LGNLVKGNIDHIAENTKSYKNYLICMPGSNLYT